MQKNYIIYAAIFLVVASVVFFIFWQQDYFKAKENVPATQNQPATSTSPAKESESLGETIYEGTQNPVKDKLPDSNPFGSYKNPFESR